LRNPIWWAGMMTSQLVVLSSDIRKADLCCSGGGRGGQLRGVHVCPGYLGHATGSHERDHWVSWSFHIGERADERRFPCRAILASFLLDEKLGRLGICGCASCIVSCAAGDDCCRRPSLPPAHAVGIHPSDPHLVVYGSWRYISLPPGQLPQSHTQ